jgi:PAS domain S-box-containing protein
MSVIAVDVFPEQAGPDGSAPPAVMVYAFDAAGVCTLSEGPGLARIGLSPGQLVGQPVRRVFADQPAVIANIDQVLAGRRVRNVTVVDGVALDTVIEPQFGPDGRVVGAFGTSVDVTQAHESQRRITEQARRNRGLARLSARLAEDTPDVDLVLADAARLVADLLGGYVAFWLIDRAAGSPSVSWHVDPAKRALIPGLLAQTSASTPLLVAAEALACGRPVALGRADLAGMLPPDAEHVRAVAGIEAVAHAPLVARGETLGVIAVYREDVASADGHGEFDDDELDLLGEVAGLTAMALANARLLDDLSAANEELQKFRALADASGDFIATAGLDGVITYVNPAGRRLAGIGDEDVSSLRLSEVYPPEARGHVELMCRNDPAAPVRWTTETRLQARDGSSVDVGASTFQLHHPVTLEPIGVGTVQRDLTDQRLAEKRERQLAASRKAALARQISVVEAERARIAADVHDDSIQVLAAVDLRLGLLRRQLAHDAPAHLGLLDRLHSDIQDAIARLRTLLFDLEAPAREQPLGDALRHLVARSFDDIDLQWFLDDETTRELPERVRTAAYRICQEALANIRRHAGAHRVWVRLTDVDEGVLLQVSDDGRGSSVDIAEPRAGHLGLIGMRERAAAVHGHWWMQSRPGEGTVVSAWLPVQDDSRPTTREVGVA